MNEYKILNKLKYKMLENKHDGFNIGAVVLDKKNVILNYGFNSYVKTHTRMLHNPLYNTHQIFVHAECDAIYGLNYKVVPYTIIICRLNKKNEFMNAKPCAGCYLEIKNAGIRHVYYTNENGELTLLDTTVPTDEYGDVKKERTA